MKALDRMHLYREVVYKGKVMINILLIASILTTLVIWTVSRRPLIIHVLVSLTFALTIRSELFLIYAKIREILKLIRKIFPH